MANRQVDADYFFLHRPAVCFRCRCGSGWRRGRCRGVSAGVGKAGPYDVFVHRVPSVEGFDAFADGSVRPVANGLFDARGVGVGFVDVARLHGHHFHNGPRAGHLLDGADEVGQPDGLGTADVVDGMGYGRGRRIVEQEHDALGDVVDVGEVAPEVAVVEDPDGTVPDDGVHELDGSHVGAAPRTVDREEAQAGGADAVQVAVGMRHQFVAFLGGRIEAHRLVGVAAFGIRHLVGHAVDAARAGIEQMADGMVAAVFEDVEESEDVALHVGVGVADGIAHAGLPGEMDDGVEVRGVE